MKPCSLKRIWAYSYHYISTPITPPEENNNPQTSAGSAPLSRSVKQVLSHKIHLDVLDGGSLSPHGQISKHSSSHRNPPTLNSYLAFGIKSQEVLFRSSQPFCHWHMRFSIRLSLGPPRYLWLSPSDRCVCAGMGRRL